MSGAGEVNISTNPKQVSQFSRKAETFQMHVVAEWLEKRAGHLWLPSMLLCRTSVMGLPKFFVFA